LYMTGSIVDKTSAGEGQRRDSFFEDHRMLMIQGISLCC